MSYTPAENRYEKMSYRRCGTSGLKLPAISLGLWQNFGDDTPHQTKRDMCCTAFDLGIAHFDLANNYALLLSRQKPLLAKFYAVIFGTTAPN